MLFLNIEQFLIKLNFLFNFRKHLQTNLGKVAQQQPLPFHVPEKLRNRKEKCLNYIPNN